jgi:hypothetical protein
VTDSLFENYFCGMTEQKVVLVEKIGYPEWMDVPDKAKMFVFRVSAVEKKEEQ